MPASFSVHKRPLDPFDPESPPNRSRIFPCDTINELLAANRSWQINHDNDRAQHLVFKYEYVESDWRARA